MNQEKHTMPNLLSKYDLRKRWNMESRQSLYNYTRRPDFPDPVFQFSNGKTPVYLETDIEMYELKYPWITCEHTRKKYSYWVLKNVANNPNNPNNIDYKG